MFKILSPRSSQKESSSASDERTTGKISKVIDKTNSDDHEKECTTVKVLMVGVGNADKSTLIRQLRMHQDMIQEDCTPDTQLPTDSCSFEETDQCRDKSSPFLHGNMVYHTLMTETKVLVASLDKAENKRLTSQVDMTFPEDAMRVNEFRTKPVEQHEVCWEGVTIHFYDVGSNFKTKHIKQCFDDITAVLFVIPLSDFDLEVSPIEENLKWMEELQWALPRSIPFIVFFNKIEVLEAKTSVGNVRIQDFYPEFDPQVDGDAKTFFAHLFVKAVKEAAGGEREMYWYFSYTNDVVFFKGVWNALKDIILKANLNGAGFM